MPSAVLCLTAVCALLLSLTDASTPFREKDAWAVQATNKSWPGLRLDITLKGSAKVFGESNPLLYAKPFLSDNGKSVVYSVFTGFSQNFTLRRTKTVDTIYTVETTYTVVDGVAFTSNISTLDDFKNRTFECLDSEVDGLALPPVNAIVQGIMSAKLVSAGTGQCPGGQYKFTVKRDTFELCRVSDQRITMAGRDMDIAVRSSDILGYPPNFNQDSVCRHVVKPVCVTPTGKSLLTELK